MCRKSVHHKMQSLMWVCNLSCGFDTLCRNCNCSVSFHTAWSTCLPTSLPSLLDHRAEIFIVVFWWGVWGIGPNFGQNINAKLKQSGYLCTIFCLFLSANYFKVMDKFFCCRKVGTFHHQNRAKNGYHQKLWPCCYFLGNWVYCY